MASDIHIRGVNGWPKIECMESRATRTTKKKKIDMEQNRPDVYMGDAVAAQVSVDKY